MSNKTDWKGLDQYINYLYGSDDNDRLYALREVGNIFPKWVSIGYHPEQIPPYIPRVKNMIAVQNRGYQAWHPYGIMAEEERMAVLKYYSGGWVTVASGDSIFQYYDSGWQNVKWAKYYDGDSWITFWSLVPSGFMALFTSDPAGWTERNTDFHTLYLRGDTSTGITGGSNTHSHSNVTVVMGAVTTSYSGDEYSLGLNVGAPAHTHGTYISHTANSQTFYPTYCYYRLFQSPGNALTHIPSGAKIFWSGTTGDIPTGWTYSSSNNGYHLRVSSSGVGSNVAAYTTGHSTSGNSSTNSTGTGSTRIRSGSTSVADAAISHNHGINSTSHTNGHGHSSVTVPYFNVILISADNDTGEIPVGGVAPFYAAPGTILDTTWSRVTAADGYLLLPSSSYGGTGGSSTHEHSHTGLYGASTSVASQARQTGSGYGMISSNHYHTLSGAAHPSSTENSFPAYKTLLLYERTA
ncbi:MAG: hypothetical protein PHQ86_02745 [Dehalococcoidales bacterium]|nr:hypothetical protein [Dehalococcoidales bacterium]